MNTINITIGIPAYNEELNIVNCLNSIRQQTGDGFRINQIIVISDGSDDQTVINAQTVAQNDSRVQVIQEPQRQGQNIRQNQIIELMDPSSSGLFILEADRILDNPYYLQTLVDLIPPNGHYSFIVGRSEPLTSNNFFEKVMVFGFHLRRDIFDCTTDSLNLHQCTSARLYSREFLQGFRWEEGFHEDTYSYRKALETGLPIITTKKAFVRFRAVRTFSDYLSQSGKYQKASEAESQSSNIYRVRLNWPKVMGLLFFSFIKHPILLSTYIASMIVSRLNKFRLPKYDSKWEIYKSSKKLTNE